MWKSCKKQHCTVRQEEFCFVLNLFGTEEGYYNSANESRFDKEPTKQFHPKYCYAMLCYVRAENDVFLKLFVSVCFVSAFHVF